MLPLRFEYVVEQRVYVSILQQFKHHYTGETIYRVRQEYENGYANESLYTENELRRMLALKVEEEK